MTGAARTPRDALRIKALVPCNWCRRSNQCRTPGPTRPTAWRTTTGSCWRWTMPEWYALTQGEMLRICMGAAERICTCAYDSVCLQASESILWYDTNGAGQEAEGGRGAA